MNKIIKNSVDGLNIRLNTAKEGLMNQQISELIKSNIAYRDKEMEYMIK